jgi:hypothetical protein
MLQCIYGQGHALKMQSNGRQKTKKIRELSRPILPKQAETLIEF